MPKRLLLIITGLIIIFFSFCSKHISEGSTSFSMEQLNIQVKVVPSEGGKAVFIITSKKGFKLLLNPAPKIRIGAEEIVISGTPIPEDAQYFKTSHPIAVMFKGQNKIEFELNFIYCVEADLTCVPKKIKLRLSASGNILLAVLE